MRKAKTYLDFPLGATIARLSETRSLTTTLLLDLVWCGMARRLLVDGSREGFMMRLVMVSLLLLLLLLLMLLMLRW